MLIKDIISNAPHDDAKDFAQTPEVDELADGPLLRSTEVARITSLDEKTNMRLVEQERFPAPLQLSDRRRAWKRRDLRVWLENPYGWVPF